MAWVAWFTGLPGSGKSSIAREVARRLEARGIRVRVLELDEIRRVVTPSPNYTAQEREVVYRALAYMAWLLYNEGVSVIIDATAHIVRASGSYQEGTGQSRSSGMWNHPRGH